MSGITNPTTGKIEEKITVPYDSADETEFKTEIQNGISEVPDSFKDKEHLNTPDKRGRDEESDTGEGQRNYRE